MEILFKDCHFNKEEKTLEVCPAFNTFEKLDLVLNVIEQFPETEKVIMEHDVVDIDLKIDYHFNSTYDDFHYSKFVLLATEEGEQIVKEVGNSEIDSIEVRCNMYEIIRDYILFENETLSLSLNYFNLADSILIDSAEKGHVTFIPEISEPKTYYILRKIMEKDNIKKLAKDNLEDDGLSNICINFWDNKEYDFEELCSLDYIWDLQGLIIPIGMKFEGNKDITVLDQLLIKAAKLKLEELENTEDDKIHAIVTDVVAEKYEKEMVFDSEDELYDFIENLKIKKKPFHDNTFEKAKEHRIGFEISII